MADRPPQSAASHTRWYPLFHFVAFPLVLVPTLYAIYQGYQEPSTGSVLTMLFMAGVVCAVFASRVMAVAVQDRVIRLEETLRFQRLLPPAMHDRIAGLDRRQVVALRFASDAEVADLVRRTLEGELTTSRQIKSAIREWRADWHRA